MKAAHEAHSAAFGKLHEAITGTEHRPCADRDSARRYSSSRMDEASKRLVTAFSDAAEVLSAEQRAALREGGPQASRRLAARDPGWRIMQSE